ncbi:dicarboxylate/amino acid:cation symporter [uncultured Abyssibacter sp.]|uniref:dicarboxylate/amino acid:cation symporter n=1 Tax=uncultured Abyssibacter sp. TaxID=2320202 RepID=UPI0032B12707
MNQAQLHPRNLKHLADRLQGLVRTHLWAQVLVGMALGVAVGILIGPSVGWFEPQTAHLLGEWLALPGLVFLALIQTIVVPLVLTAIVRGIASTADPEQLKRGGIWLVVYFVVTTVIASSLGIGLGLLLKPGELVEAPAGTAEVVVSETQGDGSVDLGAIPSQLVSLFPTNPLGSMTDGEMLQVVLFAVLIGLALISVPASTAKPMLEVLGSLQALCMTVVGWAMRLAPLAAFGLLARQMASTGPEVLIGLSAYVGAVLLGLACLFGLYALIVWVLGDRQPGRFLAKSGEAQLLAFSTNSSAATMPITIRVAEDKLHVRSSIAQFVIPIGATVNMGGTALYQGMATVFMAQVYGMDLPLAALVGLVVTALGASIGTPATPGVGIVVLASVLTSVGVPVAGLGLILGVDQLLERFRTVLNVSGDLAACTVMDRWLGGSRSRHDEQRQERAVEAIRRRDDADVVITS